MPRGEREGRGDERWTDSSHIVDNFIDCSQFTQTLTTLIVMRCLQLYSGQLDCCGQCQGRSKRRERESGGRAGYQPGKERKPGLYLHLKLTLCNLIKLYLIAFVVVE